jgi:hypothetical protein
MSRRHKKRHHVCEGQGFCERSTCFHKRTLQSTASLICPKTTNENPHTRLTAYHNQPPTMKFSTVAILSCLSTASSFAPQTFSARPAPSRLASTTADEVEAATSAMAESTSKSVTVSPTGTVDKVDISLGFEGVNSGSGAKVTDAMPKSEPTAAASVKSSPPTLVKIDKSKIKP